MVAIGNFVTYQAMPDQLMKVIGFNAEGDAVCQYKNGKHKFEVEAIQSELEVVHDVEDFLLRGGTSHTGRKSGYKYDV